MTKIFNGALVGCGFFAQNHLKAWRDLGSCDPGARLIAVCDRDGAKARVAAESFGVPIWYTDAEEMFAEAKLDFVDIVTTMPSHRQLVESACRYGIPIIVQKPLAPSWEDCVAIVEVARAARVPLMVHENFRFQAPLLKAHAAVASGEIGEPVWGRFSFRTNYDVYANQPYLMREKQLIILDLGIHLLDVARVFMGEVTTVFCEAQRLNAEVLAEDAATILLRHVSGAVSVVECSFESRRIPDLFPQTLIHLEGRRGCLRVDPDFVMEVSSNGRMRREAIGSSGSVSKPWQIGPESVLNAQAHWLDCLAAGAVPATSGIDNLKTYALVVAAYESAKTKRAVAPRIHTEGG
jgi:predicted dehydrogenase